MAVSRAKACVFVKEVAENSEVFFHLWDSISWIGVGTGNGIFPRLMAAHYRGGERKDPIYRFRSTCFCETDEVILRLLLCLRHCTADGAWETLRWLAVVRDLIRVKVEIEWRKFRHYSVIVVRNTPKKFSKINFYYE